MSSIKILVASLIAAAALGGGAFYMYMHLQDRTVSEVDTVLVVLSESGTADISPPEGLRMTLSPGGVARQTLRIRNGTAAPLTGLRLVPSCGCTHAVISTRDLPPGESAVVAVTTLAEGARTAGMSLGIASNEKTGFVIQFAFDFAAAADSPAVVTEPKALVVDGCNAAPSTEAALAVRLPGGRSWEDITMDTSHPSVVVARVGSPDPDGTHRLRVSLGHRQTGAVSEQIYLFTNQSGGQQAGVAVPVTGWIRPAYTTVPSVVELGLIPTKERGVVQIRVRTDPSVSIQPRYRTEGDWEIVQPGLAGGPEDIVTVGIAPGSANPGSKHGRLLIDDGRGGGETVVPLHADLE